MSPYSHILHSHIHALAIGVRNVSRLHVCMYICIKISFQDSCYFLHLIAIVVVVVVVTLLQYLFNLISCTLKEFLWKYECGAKNTITNRLLITGFKTIDLIRLSAVVYLPPNGYDLLREIFNWSWNLTQLDFLWAFTKHHVYADNSLCWFICKQQTLPRYLPKYGITYI